MTINRGAAALAAHEQYRQLGYETLPVRLERIVDTRGVEKKSPKFPGGSWESARAATIDAKIVRGYADVALFCGQTIVGLDFDRREGEGLEDVRRRADFAIERYRLHGCIVEATARGFHVVTRAPAPNGKPWKKLVWGAPHLVDEVQIGEALLFVEPSLHPLSKSLYRRLTPLRAVHDLPVCPVELLHEPEPEPDPGTPFPPPHERHTSGTGGRSRGDWRTLDIVGLFQSAGLYLKDHGNGKHGVRCPWEAAHTSGSDGTDTVVFEAKDSTGPTFRCLHAHCENRRMRDVREFFGGAMIDKWCPEEWRPSGARYEAALGTDADPVVTAAVGAPTEKASEPSFTDTGNAARLAELHGMRLHHVAMWGRWLVERNGFWTIDYRDVLVRELSKDVGRRMRDAAAEAIRGAEGPEQAAPAKKRLEFALRSLEARRIRDMVDLARGVRGIPLDHELLDANPWLLGVKNGVIDLRTGTLRPARAGDLMTLQCPVAWIKEAQAPRWRRALEEWFPDSDTRAYVQRLAGSALVGAQHDHVFVIHYGGGRNGKGTFIRALQRVLGPHAKVIHLSLLVEQRQKEHDTVKADLFRARLAVASETKRRVRLDEASVKNLTGGDRIKARRMREDQWEFDPSHSLWLQTNHLPEITGRDRGIWSRIRVVRWVSTFEGKEERALDETLGEEADGILVWLVEGCLEWQEHGLAEPEAVVRDTLAYRNTEDVLARFATDTGLEFKAELTIPAAEMQRLLNEWAAAEGVDPPRTELGTWLHDQGASQKREWSKDADGKRRQARLWRGVGVPS